MREDPEYARRWYTMVAVIGYHPDPRRGHVIISPKQAAEIERRLRGDAP
jgi:hypothetical protein